MVFFLSIFGMICWGLAPVFAKLGLVNVNPMAGLALRTYISTSFLTVWVLCSGTWLQFRDISKTATWLIAIEALLATLVGDLAYYAALKYGDVSFVTLIMACSPLVSIITAVLFLNEQVTWTRLIGGILVIAGICFITFETK